MAQRIVILAFLLTLVYSENPISIPKPASTEAKIPRKEDPKVVSTDTKTLVQDLPKDDVVSTENEKDPRVISTDIKPLVLDHAKEELILPDIKPVVPEVAHILPNPTEKPLKVDTKTGALADTPVADDAVPPVKTLVSEDKVPRTESTVGDATETEPKSMTKESVPSLRVQKSLKDLLKTNEKFVCAGTDYTAALRVKFEASSLSEETIANLFVFASCKPHCPNNARLLGVSAQVNLVNSGTTEASVSLSDKCNLKVLFDESDFSGVVIQEQAELPTQGTSV